MRHSAFLFYKMHLSKDVLAFYFVVLALKILFLNPDMKEHSIDETTIKKIVGHSGAMTLTERVYTHLDVRVLIDAINKIVGERGNGKEEK